MRALMSVLMIMAGVWLLHMGYARQQSLAGKTDNTIAKIGQSIDGEDHATTQGRYYVAGGLLDVYKRQSMLYVIQGAEAFNRGDGDFSQVGLHAPDARTPVSYTHLDVYKRQGRGLPGGTGR